MSDPAPAVPAEFHGSSDVERRLPVRLAALVGEVTEVGVASLRPADSPRLAGTDQEHARALAELDTELPPILVNRRTMQVVDGMHRLLAARASGRSRVPVQFCDGSKEEAFVLAVALNAACGLPLTLADRRAAARRILRSYPHLSDRSIAAIVRLAPNTVAKVRRSTVHSAQSQPRLGKDGRMRPVDGASRRMAAGEIARRRPEASLREIAAAADVSLSTARNVRARVRDGQDPAPAPRRRSAARSLPDPRAVLANLRADPSLRYKESGRMLLRWLEAHSLVAGEWREFLDGFPPHCANAVGQVARASAVAWTELAEEMAQLTDRSGG